MKRNKLQNKSEQELSTQTVRLDPAFLKRVKTKMLDSGDSLQGLVVRLLEEWLEGGTALVRSCNEGTGVTPEAIEKALGRLRLDGSVPTLDGSIMAVPYLLVGVVEDLKNAEIKDERDVQLIDAAIHYCAPFLHLNLDAGTAQRKKQGHY